MVPRSSVKETSSTAVNGAAFTQGAPPRMSKTLVRFSATMTSSVRPARTDSSPSAGSWSRLLTEEIIRWLDSDGAAPISRFV